MSVAGRHVGRGYRFALRQYRRAVGRAASATPAGPIGAMCMIMSQLPTTPEQLLRGYALGMFPMEKRGRVQWESPDPRGVIPLDRLHIPSRDARHLRRGLFDLRFDHDPRAVVAACADRGETWLGPRLRAAYLGLFELGAMHTVEAYDGDRLVGGAFGVAIGNVFTVDSMFHRANHASKLAFAHVCQHVAERGFAFVDCQYLPPHVARFGAIEMPRAEYRDHVARGLLHPASFDP